VAIRAPRIDPFTLTPLAAANAETAAKERDSGTAIFVYGRTTLALACADPVRLSAFPPGRQPDTHFDAGSHELAVEPGVYLARPGVEVTGSGGVDVDVVRIVGGRPTRRAPRRLFQMMPFIRRRELARFLRRPAPAPRPMKVVRRVLVIDEDPVATIRYARGFGAERTVLSAADAATARELAQTAPCDLAIIELRIGDTSGIDLGRELKRAHPGLAVALCSGYLSIASAVAALRAGFDTVLFKPATAREILHRVGAVVDGPEPAVEPDGATLELAEQEHISRVLADCGGNISRAAHRLGIYRSSLQRRLRRTRAAAARQQQPHPPASSP
jgi:two-component system response regulator RegA